MERGETGKERSRCVDMEEGRLAGEERRSSSREEMERSAMRL